jgi:hypothetical protein
LFALLRLVHLRIALLLPVLGRRWRMQNGRVFQIVKLIVAIFRTKVSRAMSGRIPLASSAL